NQPSILQARANVQAAEARVIQNRAPLLPQLTSLDSYQRKTGNFAKNPGSGVNLPTSNSLDTSNNWNFGLTLSQKVYDFQSLETFRASAALARSQSASEKATILSIEAGVRSTYFNARAQKALIQVAKETLDNR